jgi:hypothetical protein
MEARTLEQREFCAIHHEVPVAPLRANLRGDPCLCALLLLQSRQMNNLVMQREQCEHDTVRAVDDGAWADTSPVPNRLGACSVAVVSCAVEKDGQLSGDRFLGDVGVVAEHRVSADLLDEPVEGASVNTNLAPVLVGVVLAPDLKELDLRGFLDLGVVA